MNGRPQLVQVNLGALVRKYNESRTCLSELFNRDDEGNEAGEAALMNDAGTKWTMASHRN